MTKLMKKMWSNEKGFTLMELIIVIVILGILALIAVPRLIGFSAQAEKAADKEYQAIVARSGELYWAANKSTDTTIALGDLTDTDIDGIGGDAGAAEGLVANPSWGQNMQFYPYIGFAFDDTNGVAYVALSEDNTIASTDIFYTVGGGYSSTLPTLPTGVTFDVVKANGAP